MDLTNPDTAAFLRLSLQSFLDAASLNRQGWNLSRISIEISHDESIDGTISDTTVGRFLDSANPQRPSPSTLKMVSDFLIKRKVITHDSIRLSGLGVAEILPQTINEYYLVGKSEKVEDFYHELSGDYYSLIGDDTNTVFSKLHIFQKERARSLYFRETILISRSSLVAENFEIRSSVRIGDQEQYFKSLIADLPENITRYESQGFALAGSDLLILFANPLGRLRPFVTCVDELRYRSDELEAMVGDRNFGWRLAGNETMEQDTATPRSAFMRITKRQSWNKSYDDVFGVVSGEGSTYTYRTTKLPITINNDILLDVNSTKAENEDLKKQLVECLESGDFNLFTDCLESGADPNTVDPATGEPIVFGLAADGMTKWVKAILETGRCDLRLRDKMGFPASYRPFAIAESIGPSSEQYDPTMFQNFLDLGRMLHRAEIVQVSRVQAENPRP